MRQSLIFVVLLAGCGGAADPVSPSDAREEPRGGTREEARQDVREPPRVEQGQWGLQSSGEGTTLVLRGAPGDTDLRLFCPAGTGRWLVNAPRFHPIASEERFSFGHASNVATLVADASGDAERGGVTGVGPITPDLPGLLSGPVSASYGAQASGPHPAPAPELVAAFVEACLDGAPPSGTPSTPASPVGACRVQDTRTVPPNALRAVGTEPFWGARVDGRCVTYSHPDDQTGTRVWTTFAGTASDGTWTGALRGKPFVMRTRPTPCSDGMSDTRYPITVALTVGGEQRHGCAAPR